MSGEAWIGGVRSDDTTGRDFGERRFGRRCRRVDGGRSAARSEAIARAVVRVGVGGRGVVAGMRRLGSRRAAMRSGPGLLGWPVDHGMLESAVVRASAHGGGLQVLRGHEPRDQQKSGGRWESAPTIAPDHHVSILESAYRSGNPVMAREPPHPQFGVDEIHSATRVYSFRILLAGSALRVTPRTDRG